MSHNGLGHAAYVLFSDGTGGLIAPLGYSQDKVVNVDISRTDPDLVTGITKAFQEKSLQEGKVGIAGMDVLPAEYYLRLGKSLGEITLETADSLIESQRIIKSPAEIEILKEAAKIAGIGLKAGLAAIKAGATQHDVEFAARKAAFDAGADFIPRVRVSSGKRIKTLTWPMTSKQVLEDGDFVFLDLIGWYSNYGWDNSRVAVVGKPTTEQQSYLDHLREATDWMLEVMKPGKKMELVYTESRTRQIVPMAHGIGLEICENPWVNPNQYFTLQPGMVLCVEPILFTPEFGGMSIEDTVVVAEDRLDILTPF
jgi:Xaa-Pro aminopeptidase